MYTRSITDKIKIQFEIWFENCTDFVSRNSLRTPLLVMAGIAVMMTLKNARSSIDMIKGLSTSPFGYKKPSSSFTPYGRSASTYGRSSYSSPYGAGQSTVGQQGIGGGHMQYGQRQQQQQQYGGMPNAGGYGSGSAMNPVGFNQAAPAYNAGNLRGSAVTPVVGGYGGNVAGGAANFQTSNLIAKYGASIQSIPPGLFQDFTSMMSFSGQIETLSAPDSAASVDQTLRTPGAGKILVVDGGGSTNGLFDSSMAMVAQQNGWKGVIINGYVVDPPALQAQPLGVKALGQNPMRGMQQMGQRSVPLTIASIFFNPGSWVYADAGGIVISPTRLDAGGTMGNPMGNTMGNPMGTAMGNTIGAPGAYGASSAMNVMTPQQPYNAGGMAATGAMGAAGGMAANGMAQSPYGTAGGVRQPVGGMAQQRYGTTQRTPRTGSRSSYNTRSSGNYSSLYGHGRKKPSKRTLMAMLLFVSAIIWVLLGE